MDELLERIISMSYWKKSGTFALVNGEPIKITDVFEQRSSDYQTKD